MAVQQKDQKHELCLSNCQEGQISGVQEVLSFDTELIRLETSCGNLTIKGSGLHIGELSLETGSVQLTGQVVSIQYSRSKKAADAGRHLLKKMFQ